MKKSVLIFALTIFVFLTLDTSAEINAEGKKSTVINKTSMTTTDNAEHTEVESDDGLLKGVIFPAGEAFGVQLGKRFKNFMVDSVIDRQPQSYSGANGSQLVGEIIHVVPNTVDERFHKYFVKTTADGIVYSIRAEYQFDVEPAMGKKMGQVKQARNVRSDCKAVVNDLAVELDQIYGAPRGRGLNGEWFSFRNISENTDISISLYANRCRSGFYNLIIVDEKMRRQLKKG